MAGLRDANFALALTPVETGLRLAAAKWPSPAYGWLRASRKWRIRRQEWTSCERLPVCDRSPFRSCIHGKGAATRRLLVSMPGSGDESGGLVH